MKRINVITTIEVPDNFNAEQIYNEYRMWIRDAHLSGDLSVWTFTDMNGDEVE